MPRVEPISQDAAAVAAYEEIHESCRPASAAKGGFNVTPCRHRRCSERRLCHSSAFLVDTSDGSVLRECMERKQSIVRSLVPNQRNTTPDMKISRSIARAAMPWVCGLPSRSALPPTRALRWKYCFVWSRNRSAPLPVSAAINPSCQARKRLHMHNKEALVITSVIDRKKIKPNRRSHEVLNPDRFFFCTDASMPMHAVFAVDKCDVASWPSKASAWA